MNNNQFSTEVPKKALNKLAVLLPGYLDSKDYNHLKTLSKDLAEIGYMSLRLDPTGTWSSKEAIEKYSFSHYLDDVSNAIKYAEGINGKKFDSIVLLGHSLGGQIALLYASTRPNISSVIGIMPSPSVHAVSSVQRAQQKWNEEGYRLSKRDLPENPEQFNEFKVSVAFLEDRAKYNVLDSIAAYKQPLLLIAGEKDSIIEPKLVEEIYNKANEPKEFIIIPDVGHDYRHNKEELSRVNKIIIDYLKDIK